MKDQAASNPAALLLKEDLKALNERIERQTESVQRSIQSQLGESTRMFGETTKIVRDVTERLTKLDETNRQVVNFADQLKRLQDTLNNPKQRGVLGEYYLETVLKNVLPPKHYKLQYRFRDGEIVDAAIFIQDKVIPIDAKFSLENYNRLVELPAGSEHERIEKQFKQDLKNRIDETSKYIRPAENTMDFAFMFIPAEAIYYDLLVHQVGQTGVSSRDLIDYAFKEKHVIIVSPTSFFAYLQTVLQGLRALQIEESAKEIRQNIVVLAKHLQSYEGYMERLGKQIDTTQNTYEAALKQFKSIDKDVLKIAEAGEKAEPVVLEKPNVE
ncbi:MAG: DNA recombination protein RmuC [Candidatus Kerfeldbacteria bacterium]|nr:DNA recombination protein RmuC [Candidatus Kerfeldbacteria bacterium]